MFVSGGINNFVYIYIYQYKYISWMLIEIVKRSSGVSIKSSMDSMTQGCMAHKTGSFSK